MLSPPGSAQPPGGPLTSMGYKPHTSRFRGEGPDRNTLSMMGE